MLNAQADTGLAAGYRPPLATQDELVDARGEMRPVWSSFMRHLLTLTPDDRTKRLARADQYLMDSGVFYRQYGTAKTEGGQSVERPWPLSHVPVLIAQGEWQGLSDALIQRADLLEAVMADLYGENRLVAEGKLPAALIAANPEWLRPMVGVRPRDGHYLHFLAFEIGRGPDGNWWVLADRAQAPSGAGYALENRVATSRAFSEIYTRMNVPRLAGFFRDFRDHLQALRRDAQARVVILTPGTMNETYYEHAYIARYLGFTLVEGEDLTVAGDRLMVRTVSGLRPVDVLWRRMDSAFADPVELNQQSRIGTAGLVSALRAQGLTMVNALGSGVLETRALMAFLPQLAPDLVGAPLKMPNIATWWCGGVAEQQAVLANPARMVMSDAFATGLPYEGPLQGLAAADLSTADLAAKLAADGPRLVAQEVVTLSTTPALVAGRLKPRPLSLRVFLARTGEGWQVMPGGFARIGASPEPTAIAMQNGGNAADVWIVADKPQPAVSMVAPPGTSYRRATPGSLPSRAADNLFWLGRYVERAEGIMRLLRARNIRLAEAGEAAAPLLAVMDPLLTALGAAPDKGVPAGLLSTIGAAIGSAGHVRDRFSPDAWQALIDLNKTATHMAARVTPGDDAARALSALLRKLTGFSGLVHENMYRFLGWRFLTIGRHHERAMGMAANLAVLADAKAPDGALDLAIEVGDSVMTHRRRFSLQTSRVTVIDLLALDEMNPRSMRYQLDGMVDQMRLLPQAEDYGMPSDLTRAMMRLHTDLATTLPEDLTTQAIWALRGRIAGVSDLLTGAYLR